MNIKKYSKCMTIILASTMFFSTEPTFAKTSENTIAQTPLEVNITCPKLKKVLVDKYDGTNGGQKDGKIESTEIEKVKYMNLSNNGITDLTGLEKATNLEKINLNNNNITSVEPLQNLKKLIDLRLNGNSISETKQVQSLNKLISNNTTLKVYIKSNKFDFNDPDLLSTLSKHAKDYSKLSKSWNLDFGEQMGARLIYEGESEIFLKGDDEFVMPNVLSPDDRKYDVILSVGEESKVSSFKASHRKLFYKLVDKETNKALDFLVIQVTIDQPPKFVYKSKDKVYTGDKLINIFEDRKLNDIPLLMAIDDFDGKVDVSMTVDITKDNGKTVYNVVYLAEDSSGNKSEFPVSIDVS